MVESVALKASNDGFVLTRTWTDAKWAEAQSTKSDLCWVVVGQKLYLNLYKTSGEFL